jgi:uncharacterized lipoprotein NlpE involved in copper resistance
MKTTAFKTAYILIFGIILMVPLILVDCDNKDDKEPDPLVGNYVFSGATFEETVIIKIQDVDTTFDPGSDASAFVSEGLLGAAPCDNSTNAAIAFRADGKSFYICLGETNESQMGTWIINADRTVLTLYIGNPMAFGLEIGNLNLTETVISGTVENFPLPLTTAVELGMTFGDPPTVNIQVKEVTVEFTRVQ